MAINLLTDNQASVETDTTGFQMTAASTITRDTAEQLHGVASLKTVTSNSGSGEGFTTLSRDVSANVANTASVSIKGSGTVRLFITERDSGDQSIGNTVSSVITLTGDWTRYSISRVFGATGVKSRLVVQTNVQQGITFYADKLQINEGSSATEWRLPSQGSASPSASISLSPSVSISLSPSSSQSPSASISLSPSVSISLSSSLSPSPSWPGLSGTMEVT